ncbi:MAG: Crp/Fnr family transcriptional regulator [Acidobacteriota bacterium]
MTTLTRIQKVVVLQAVDLFTYCNAEQMMRIAGIAQQRNFGAGEKIYSINDAAESMCCVVEGKVKLRGAAGRERTIGARETFGVSEILSDRLRAENAWADSATVGLVIGAEDFFDLLSNNVEIVKALFRQLLRRPEAYENLHETTTPHLAAS